MPGMQAKGGHHTEDGLAELQRLRNTSVTFGL